MGATAAICLAAEGARVIGCDLAAVAAVATEKAVRDAGGDITVMGGVALGDADRAKAWVVRHGQAEDGVNATAFVSFDEASARSRSAAATRAWSPAVRRRPQEDMHD